MRTNSTPEWKLQTRIWVYLHRALPPHAYIIGVDSGQSASAMVKIKRAERGVVPGTADLRILCDGISLDLEVKAPGGTVQASQEAHGAAIRRNRGFWEVVRSLADVEAALRLAGIPVLRTAEAHEGIAGLSRPKKQRNWATAPKSHKPRQRGTATAAQVRTAALRNRPPGTLI